MKTNEEKLKALGGLLLKNKYVLIVLLLGLVLILLPTGKKEEVGTAAPEPSALVCPSFSLSQEEERLEAALRGIEGAGEVTVLLSLKSTATRELASGADGALVVSTGGGAEGAVELRYYYPEYLGAVVVCQGANNPRVRLEIVEAVSAFTGLGSDKISINKMK